MTDGVYVPGKALPICSAGIRIAGQEQAAKTLPDETVARFLVGLEGPTTLQTWFYGADGGEICGAYYVTVRRVGIKP